MSEEDQARTWIITGASSGLGLALAKAALEAGERVAGTARRAERFGRLRGTYEGRFLAVEHDVRDTASGSHRIQDRYLRRRTRRPNHDDNLDRRQLMYVVPESHMDLTVPCAAPIADDRRRLVGDWPGNDFLFPSGGYGTRESRATWLREPGDIEDYHAFAANVREVRNHEPAPGFGPQARPGAGVILPVQIDH